LPVVVETANDSLVHDHEMHGSLGVVSEPSSPNSGHAGGNISNGGVSVSVLEGVSHG
jgi:hypothetical protein